MFVVFFKFVYGLVVFLPTSKSLSLNWNFGSFIFIVYLFQILSGLFLVFFFCNDASLAFSSVQYLMFEVNFGWFFRLLHFNGASFFFFLVFLHFFKGLFFFSYRLSFVWFFGLLILIFLMAIAFMGYVLVWAQMSFWATVVITSLLTVIPFFGLKLVFWIWGGFSVSCATLKFFFVVHFFLPWLLFFFILLHLFFLHDTGSTSKLFYCGGLMKFSFYSFFWLKDFYNFVLFFFFLVFFLIFPFNLGDPEMFIESDFLNSPVHIVPEWYFLFAYAVLRSIPNKVLGVFFLLSSLLIFLVFLFFFNYVSVLSVFNKFLVFWFFFCCVFLSWIGQCVVEYPFFFLGVLFTFFYFFLVFLIFLNYISSFFLFLYLL